MRVLGYGEDSLTLWALTQRLQEILTALRDRSCAADCEALYRPSFGRAGGPNSSQFGEFDFILLTGEGIYLGESKWDNCGATRIPSKITLHGEQRLRHEVFRYYVDNFAFGRGASGCPIGWAEFSASALRPEAVHPPKPLPPAHSLLRRHLESVLLDIRERYPEGCPVRNVLLNLARVETIEPPLAPEGFSLVPLAYGDALELEGDLIPLTI